MNINYHSLRMGLGLFVLFIVGGLQMLHGQVQFSGYIDGILPVLLMVEHFLLGNTSTTE